MKKIILFLIVALTINSYAQSPVNINIRDINTTEFQLVKLYLSILDSTGKPINDIDSSRITIIEKNTGKKVNPTVRNFYKSDEGIAICFVIDASNSMMGAPLNNIKEGMLSILSSIRPYDKMAISIFNDEFYKKTGFETDRDILRNNINDLSTGGSSSEVFKSVIEATKWLSGIESPKRKIMIVLSDGDDNGSQYKIDDCISEIKNAGITVFTVGTIDARKDIGNTLRNMEKMANSTKDGKYYKINVPEDMKNIIPAIYERIKQEYILSYFSYAEVSQNIEASVEMKEGDKIYVSEYKYKSPEKIIKNAPQLSFWETKEFLYGAIGAGVILIGLVVFLIININKKKRFKKEKEQEKYLREQEAQLNSERFAQIQQEYDNLLDQLENASEVSDADKNRIAMMEKKLEEASKTMISPGMAPPEMDFRRRTMILDSKTPIPSQVNRNGAYIQVTNGNYAGQSFRLNPAGFIIGRMEGDLIIPDSTISRSHARIFSDGNRYIIQDNNSTNGTFVNERRINQVSLNNNDVIRVGNVTLTFKE